MRILSTHIPIRIALPLIRSRALIPSLAPLFATPKMQKITTTDLQIPKRTATEQTTRGPFYGQARSSRGARRMRLALLGSVWLGSSSLLDCEVSDSLQVKNVGSRE